jgi:heat shock protein HslJ
MHCTSLALLAALLLTGCAMTKPPEQPAPAPGKPAAPLTNTRWKLTTLRGEPVPVMNREPFISFEESSGTMRGHGGCNTIGGTYTAAGNLVSITGIISTRMACPDMTVETGLINVLEATNVYAITGDTLVLRFDGVEVARFEAVYLK